MEERNPHALSVGQKIGRATVENSMESPQKIKHGTIIQASDFTSG